MKRIYLLFVIFFSCGKLLVTPESNNKPENNFEIFWREFDKYYSFFEYKGVNWDSLYNVYRPIVDNRISEKELFHILAAMLSVLKDGHILLLTPYGEYNYEGWWKDYPANYYYIIVEQYYLKNVVRLSNGKIISGDLNEELGYIHISNFKGDNDWNNSIDKVLDRLKNKKGLIIDIRNNGGGNTGKSEYLASRFADKKRLYSYIQWRNGPNHNDFTEPIPLYIEPSEKWRFIKPVAVLTNRQSFSAAESFVLAMRVFPNVTIIGSTTGGGSGSPILRELPNGWVYQIPVSVQLTPEKKFYEEKGLEPDIYVNTTYRDYIMRRDRIIDRAIVELKGKLKKEKSK
ncbi:peptidase S41 [candidate division KSB1 bacterium]|nr:MAG: peptidase S41 [candidate division KSB1 bacterium]